MASSDRTHDGDREAYRYVVAGYWAALHAVAGLSDEAREEMAEHHELLCDAYGLGEFGFEDEDAVETMRELDPSWDIESIPVASHQKIAALRRKHVHGPGGVE